MASKAVKAKDANGRAIPTVGSRVLRQTMVGGLGNKKPLDQVGCDHRAERKPSDGKQYPRCGVLGGYCINGECVFEDRLL